MVFFIQVAPDDMFCELGVGHFLRNDKLHLRRGDCEPKAIGPSSLLNHILSLSGDAKSLCTSNGGQGVATVAFTRKLCFPNVSRVDCQEAGHENSSAMLAIYRELFWQYGLHNLSREGLTEEASELLMSDSDALQQLNAYADDGLTPLHVASREGHIGMVSALLDHGAVVNQRRLGHRSTPLHYAIQYQHVGVVELLLKHGAYVDRKAWDHFNRSFTAMHMHTFSSAEMQELLFNACPELAVFDAAANSGLVNGSSKRNRIRDKSLREGKCKWRLQRAREITDGS